MKSELTHNLLAVGTGESRWTEACGVSRIDNASVLTLMLWWLWCWLL